MSGEDKQRRVRLQVVGLSINPIKSKAYALILAETGGIRHIPIVINEYDAQSVAMKLENVPTSRPLTHDLFVSFAHAFGVKLKEVFIYKYEDGVFSAELTFDDGDRTVAIDSRTSDAIAIAMRTRAPIYTTEAIIEETGFVLEQSLPRSSSGDGVVAEPEPRIENYAIEELQRELDRCIAMEDYEGAARIRELIDKKLGEATDGDDDDPGFNPFNL